jgi:alpha-glucosidase
MDPDSMLRLYHRLLALRHAEPALSAGAYRQVFVNDDVLVFARVLGDRCLCVALNCSGARQHVSLPAPAQPLLSTTPESAIPARTRGIKLRPFEGVIMVATQPI